MGNDLLGFKGSSLRGREIAAASLAILLAGSSPIFADITGVTGDPSANGWSLVGNTLASGIYSDGAAMYSANMYTTAFTLGGAASAPLVGTFAGWNAGDTVVGVGGDFVSTTAAAGGWSAYAGSSIAVNSDLTYDGALPTHPTGSTSTRIVVKYSASVAPAGWKTSTAAPKSGNGVSSLGNAGVGSILLGTNPYDFSPANSGVLINPTDSPLEQTASAQIAISSGVGQVITLWSGSTLVGFESFLDVTLLNSLYGSSATPPAVAPGNEFDLDLQRGTGDVTDAMGVLTSVPEPGTLSLMVVLAGVGLFARRRRA